MTPAIYAYLPSTIFRKMRQADSPMSIREEFFTFHCHMTTLLTGGTSSDKEAKRAIAVTATIEESNMKALIIVQNSPNTRQNAFEPCKLDITTFEKNLRHWLRYTIGTILLSVKNH